MKRIPELSWLRSVVTPWASIQDASLRRHLQNMGSMLAVQHTLHSQIDIPGIVHAVLDYARHIHPCDTVAVGLLKASHPRDLELFTSLTGTGASHALQLSVGEEAELHAHSGPVRIALDGAEEVPQWAEPMAAAGMRSAVVLPMAARERTCGILALGSTRSIELDVDQLPYLMGFADAAAIAFANARSVEENELLARYDVLTGLPNRRIFFDRLQAIITAADREEHLAAACFLDLDGFKRVNDTLGHAAGDRVLRQVARRLESCLRQGDSVCHAPWVAASDGPDAGEETSEEEISRLGGDEFAVLLAKVEHPHDAGLVARRLAGIFDRSFEVDGREVFLSASVGIAIYPSDGGDADSLLRNADTAMYCAKKRGKNCFQYYTKSMNSEASRKLHIETRLRSALEREEFEVWYQPQRSARSGRLIGAEALVRWNDPEMGMVSPAEFVPLAEETGCIAPIGEWVMRRACRQLREWDARGFEPIRLAVNVSAYQLRQPDFPEQVTAILAETGAPAGRLEIEITETALMEDDEPTARALEELKAAGIGLALDDFGTGYSSLSYLRRFPLDRVKIDRSFVRELPRNRDDCALSSAIIAMARGLRLEVVAEGVETEEQAHWLRESGCDELQGFLFGRPSPAETFEALLAAEKPEDDQ